MIRIKRKFESLEVELTLISFLSNTLATFFVPMELITSNEEIREAYYQLREHGDVVDAADLSIRVTHQTHCLFMQLHGLILALPCTKAMRITRDSILA